MAAGGSARSQTCTLGADALDVAQHQDHAGGDGQPGTEATGTERLKHAGEQDSQCAAAQREDDEARPVLPRVHPCGPPGDPRHAKRERPLGLGLEQRRETHAAHSGRQDCGEQTVHSTRGAGHDTEPIDRFVRGGGWNRRLHNCKLYADAFELH